MKDIQRIEIVTEDGIVTEDSISYVEICDGSIYLSYDKAPVCTVKVVWENTYFDHAKLLGDKWERAYSDIYSAAQEFCKAMCDAPRIPDRPIFGGNDWFCNYLGLVF